MLMSVHSQLRRHRRKVLSALALVAVLFATHMALMNGGLDSHMMSDGAAICFVIGGSLLVTGTAMFAVARVLQRPTWLIPSPLAMSLELGPVGVGFRVRAGPPSLLQVFQF